jgi:hypothetical protein
VPTFYKIPTHKVSGGKTVQKAYQKAGVPIPQYIKNMFKVANLSPATGLNLHITGNKAIAMFNGKQIGRYDKPTLLRIARGLPGNKGITVTNGMSKAALCKLIINATGAAALHNQAKPNIIFGEKAYTFHPQLVRYDVAAANLYGNRAPGQSHVFKTMKERNALAKAYLSNAQHVTYEGKPVNNRYNYMLAVKKGRANGTLSAKKNKTPTPTPPPPPNKAAAANNNRWVNLPMFGFAGNGRGVAKHALNHAYNPKNAIKW